MTRPLRLTPDTIHRMTLTTEPWLSCDDCFDQLDAVVERVLMQAGAMEAAFRVHLWAARCAVRRRPRSRPWSRPTTAWTRAARLPFSTRPWTTTRGRVDPSPRRSRRDGPGAHG